MTTTNFSQTAAFIWAVADLLRGDFKQSQYGRVILPFTLLRRLECVLAPTKDAVLKAYEKTLPMNLPEDGAEKLVKRVTNGLGFYNISPMDLSKLGQSDTKANLLTYVQSFSKDAREIFEHFRFDEFVGALNEANLLYKVVQKFASLPLEPEEISDHDMGLVFEELIRRFAESSNETAGEHFTPRDIVHLTTSLVFTEDDDALSKDGIIRTIYDPTAGTGGFLSAGEEYVRSHNPGTVIPVFGQELNAESYAICKADMLIKGHKVDNIKLGNTLSNDQLPGQRFDYMLSNPPFGVDWKKIEIEIKNEHTLKGFDGRFGPGLPRVSDGSLLFLLHLISKMEPYDPKNKKEGSRIGIILNGSPLFTGGAGSGESEIRRHILEADLLEAIVALPTDMFYNTGIATYIWILSNKKGAERKGKVQLINAANMGDKMRKSLGSKRNYLREEDQRVITRCFGDFAAVESYALDKQSAQKSNRGRQSANPKVEAAKTFASKIFSTHEFGYRRITIERPLRLTVQFTDAAIEGLRFATGAFKAPMEWIWHAYGDDWQAHTADIRTKLKKDFADLKEKQVKELLDAELWAAQKQLLAKAQRLQAVLGSEECHDFNQWDRDLDKALKTTAIKLDAKERKQLLDAITRKNPKAAAVIKKVVKDAANPLYGVFEYRGQVVMFEQDSDLRDAENVPLNPRRPVADLIEEYFQREVAPHVPDAWINADKRDERDGEIGVVGYEIPFNRHFYEYQPPRPLEEIDADLDAVSAEIMQLLREVHS